MSPWTLAPTNLLNCWVLAFFLVFSRELRAGCSAPSLTNLGSLFTMKGSLKLVVNVISFGTFGKCEAFGFHVTNREIEPCTQRAWLSKTVAVGMMGLDLVISLPNVSH